MIVVMMRDDKRVQMGNPGTPQRCRKAGILVSRIDEQRASLALHEDRIALPYVERDDAIPCEPTGHEDK